MIFISVIVYVIANFISAIIIYLRNTRKFEHRAFTLFFIGFAGYVFFYIFLQYSVLREFSYVLQLFSASFGVLGLFLFYYSLSHEGKVPSSLILISTIFLFLIPIVCLIFHPFTFIEAPYGFELEIELWFMLFGPIIYLIFSTYAIIGLLWLSSRTENTIVKRKIKLIFLGLFIMVIFAMPFLYFIPIIFNIHYLKPIGYFAFTIASIIMTYAFKK